MRLLTRPLKLLLCLVVLLVLLGVGAVLLADALARRGIEAGGSAALGVPVHVGSASVGLFSGRFGLGDLQVDNPPGYGAEPFLELGSGNVEVGLLSLLGDTVEIPELALRGIRLDIVQDLRGSNVGVILDSLARFQGAPDEEQGGGKRFVVRRAVVEDVVVRVAAAPQLGLAAVTLPIDRIELRDLGSGREGVRLAELAGVLVAAILERASATGLLPGAVQGVLDGRLGRLRGLVDAHVQGLESLLGGGGSGGGSGGVPAPVEGARKEIEGRLKGLLGK